MFRPAFASALRLLRTWVRNVHIAIIGKLEKFLLVQVFQLLALVVELFVELDALFLHGTVSIMRSADKMEILPAGNAYLLVIVVQSDAQDSAFLSPLTNQRSTPQTEPVDIIGRARHELNVLSQYDSSGNLRRSVSLQYRRKGQQPARADPLALPRDGRYHAISPSISERGMMVLRKLGVT